MSDQPISPSKIEHPSGTVAEFWLKPILLGRSDVPVIRDYRGLNLIDRCFANFALHQKRLSGPGLTTMDWHYRYSENPGEYRNVTGGVNPAQPVSGLPIAPAGYRTMDLRTTTVTSPDGARTLHVFT